ncbi:MAG: SIR2 family protein [Gemmataceae bacterium]|nr:SIR2 family protein [Gemmataceae bacterium]
MPDGHVFIAHGDITRLAADAIGYSASSILGRDGSLCSSFEANVPGFADAYPALRRSLAVPVAVGSSYWLPLEGRPAGVAVAVSTGRAGEDVDKPGAAVRAALAEAVKHLREARPTGNLLVALPAFRLGRGGDHGHRLASARAQVRAAHEALAGLPGVDCAFVCYTPALHRIFLEARREVLGPRPDPGQPALEEALRAGGCVLFAGAGLSAGAGLPDWSRLVASLCQELGIAYDRGLDALDVAQWHRERFGDERLAAVLRATFAGKGLPTLAHYLLLALPLRHVITTNYDGLLEQALEALKRRVVPVVRQEDVARTGGAGAVYVTKLHGDAAHPSDIVLSRDDYETFAEKRPAMALLLEALLLNQAFLFVGYSLRDPNFRTIFGRVSRMLRESRLPAFATSFESPGPTADLSRRQWARQRLEVLPIHGADGAEQVRAFLLLLDALSERVTLSAPAPVLAADTPTPPALERLVSLFAKAGAEIDELAERGELDDDDCRFLADALAFLARHGWRPEGRGSPLRGLWLQLAERAQDASLRRRLLTEALDAADSLGEMQAVQERLAKLDEPVNPPA